MSSRGGGDVSRDFRVRYAPDGTACTIEFFCFDTDNAVTLYDAGPQAEQLLLSCRELCLREHLLLSPAIVGSDIYRVNMQAGPVRVAESTAELLRAMLSFCALEPGFDFTLGALSYAWKRAERMPTDEELAHARAHVGADKLHVEGCTVTRDDDELLVDVGGSAKGHVADELAAMLRARGVTCADIDLGGNLYFIGQHPDARPWRLEVDLPEGLVDTAVMFEAHDCSVVTSSGFERSRVIDGVLCHHIIDPNTGRPVESDIASATVLGSSSLECDMLATTAVVAGTSGLGELLARHPACSAIVVTADGRVMNRGVMRIS